MGVDFVLERGWKIILVALVIAATGFAITSFIALISSAASTALAAMGVQAVAAFVPSNFNTVMTTILTVKAGGTIYVATMNFIDRKMAVLS
jgi:hypothetical protein